MCSFVGCAELANAISDSVGTILSGTGPCAVCSPQAAVRQMRGRSKMKRIAGIYNRSCKNCHAIAGVNAPLTGHVEAWEDRLAERGREGLLHSTKFGYRYMPARGLCRNCTDEEFLALIDFMLTPPG